MHVVGSSRNRAFTKSTINERQSNLPVLILLALSSKICKPTNVSRLLVAFKHGIEFTCIKRIY